MGSPTSGSFTDRAIPTPSFRVTLFARRRFAVSLTVDLGDAGHYVWLDEWEIRVGESIPTKINQGIEQCDVLLVVLSEHAVTLHWGEREWQAKYWQEVDTGGSW